MAVALPFLGLLLLEMALRVGGYGYPPDFWLPSEVQGRPVWMENHRFGWRFFPSSMARAPQPMVVDQVKPPGTMRIVVLGESAAMGDPEPAYAFGRYLGVLLREAYPDRKFEVITAAMTAINSHAVLPIARDSAKLNADLWIIYMGNNEVVGPYGSGTVFGARAPSLGMIRTALFLRTLRTGQLVDQFRQWLAARGNQPAEWGGMEMFLENKVRHDDPQMEVVYRHFQQNYADILAAGQKAGAKILVATVAANLKDCAPFASLHRVDLTATEKAEWDKWHAAGIQQLAENRPQEAVKSLLAAFKTDNERADLQFLLAEAQWATRQYRAARVSFQRALDMDALRFRVDSRLNEITRKLAAGQTNQGIWLMDAEQAIARASRQQVPGQELFWEHVHLNFEGNYQLARATAEQAARLLPLPGTNRWLSSTAAVEQLALTDWDRLQVVTEMRRRLQKAPFINQLNHSQQFRQILNLEKELKSRTTASSLKAQLAWYQKALQASPEDTILMGRHARLLEETGDAAGALAQWQAVAARMPHQVQAHYGQGTALRSQGKMDAAVACYQQALRLRPDAGEAWNGIGLCQLEAGQVDDALASFQRALRTQPNDADFHYNLGIALARKGQTNEAVASYRQALEKAADHPAARYNLANLLVRQGQLAEAEKEFQQLLKHAPEHARARNNYGSLLVRLGRPTEAVIQFRAALQREPENLEARYNLASVLITLGQIDEAISHLEQLLARQPNQPAAQRKLEEARRLRAEAGRLGPN